MQIGAANIGRGDLHQDVIWPFDLRVRHFFHHKHCEVLHKQRRVLMVDDSEDAAASLTLLIQAEGHMVETAIGGLDARRIETAFHPEAVILDL